MSFMTVFFSLAVLPPPRCTLFPYTTLFRSAGLAIRAELRPRSRARLRRDAGSVHPRVPVPRVVPGRLEVLELAVPDRPRSEEHTSELQSRLHLVCRLLLEKKKKYHFDDDYH